jgi:hypothetical protein
LLGGVAALALACGLSGEAAADPLRFHSGDLTITVDGAATLGTEIRSSAQNPALLPTADAKSIGLVGTAVKGMNQADGDLNYKKGEPVSSVVKGVFSIDAHTSDIGVFVRARTWYDWTEANSSVPFGNIPNGYTPSQPLGEKGFNADARAAGAYLLDAYVYAKYDVGKLPGEFRMGNQITPWGVNSTIAGGLLTSINGIDWNAYYRPGAQPEEVLNREPALFTKLALTDKFSVESFFRFIPSVNTPLACGSFLAQADYIQPGCNYVLAGPSTLTDAQQIATGYTFQRAPTPVSHDPQFGIGGSYLADIIHTRFGVYYAHVDDTLYLPGVVATTRSLAIPFAPSIVPGVVAQNPKYFIFNPPDLNVIALNFTTKINLTTIYGEATIKPQDPLQYNASDLLTAFATASTLQNSLLRAQANALGATGRTFVGYERFNQAQYDIGAKQEIPDILGAKDLLLNGEAALKSVYGLPNATVARFGRSDVYGIGPVNGVCATTAGETAAMIALQCSNNGYVTSNAWGYRLNAALRYANVFASGLNVTPSVGVSQDVSGWSSDNLFSQGRVLLNLGVLVDYQRRYFGGATLNPVLHAGSYDMDSDRQVFTAYAGFRF